MNTKSEETCWYVMNQGDMQRLLPHSTYADATKEARRRSKNNPGHKFYVLQSLESYTSEVVISEKTICTR